MNETATTERAEGAAPCWKCGADLSLADDVCGQCGMPQPAPEHADYFELWGVPASMDFDAAALQRDFHARSRKLHPDRFHNAGEPATGYSLERSALLNKSYRILREADARLRYLFESEKELLGIGEADSKNVPVELAEEFFEMQEALAEGDTEALDKLKARLEGLRSESQEKLDALAARWDGEKLGELRVRGEGIEARSAFARELQKARQFEGYLARMEENIGRAASGGAAD